jgi:hypothetical protein
MKRLHERVLRWELELLKLKHLAYPIFVVKVLEGLGFVDWPPMDLFYLRFDDIFNMLNTKWLHRSMVRLFVLSGLPSHKREDPRHRDIGPVLHGWEHLRLPLRAWLLFRWCVVDTKKLVGKSQEKVMMSTAASFPQLWNQGLSNQ